VLEQGAGLFAECTKKRGSAAAQVFAKTADSSKKKKAIPDSMSYRLCAYLASSIALVIFSFLTA
jgi:hypothetical protein